MINAKFVAPMLAAILALSGCGTSEGDACDPSDYTNSCSSMFNTEPFGCRECPSSAGYLKNQGYCSSGYDTSEYMCQAAWGGTSGSTTGNCTATYQGPTADPQVSTQCMSIWNYRCNQDNSTAADQNCLVYDSLEATVPCPYCE